MESCFRTFSLRTRFDVPCLDVWSTHLRWPIVGRRWTRDEKHSEPGLPFDSQGYLAGKLSGSQGEFTVSGEVVDEEVYVGFTINADGQDLSISFEGFWNESEMEGAGYFGEFGPGDWYAPRK